MPEPSALACITCGHSYPLDAYDRACTVCAEDSVASNLTVAYPDAVPPDRAALPDRPCSLWRYADLLPLSAQHAVSLAEGMTPLVAMPGLGHDGLYVKDETRNPTWSFKDRLATVAVSWAKAHGARVIATSSSGNAGAAASAYAARAGLACVVLTFRGAAGPMVAQMRATGAMVLETAEKDDRWAVLSAAVRELGWFPTSPFFGPAVGSNPIGIEGYKTIAYEIAEQLDWAVPDWCVLPVCYGDALFGIWKGFDEMQRWGWTDAVPRLAAAEVSGSLTGAIARDEPMPPLLARNAPSVAVSIDMPRATVQAAAALRRSNGVAVTIDDAAILDWQARVARTSGLFVEASSAAAFAAIDRLAASGRSGAAETVVAVATASGLKDVGIAGPPMAAPPTVGPDLDGVRRALAQAYGFDV